MPKEYAFPNRVDRDVYPRPEHRFTNARISATHEDSIADFEPPLAVPEDAPNILLVLLDDVGFGWPSVFGGLVEMPTAERLARTGLTFNQFHTTALCSPTRAALLTGRNHHTVHSGVIGELATGFPGYDGIIPKSCATIAEVLSQNGYATGWWGKNHNVPDNQTSEAGPFPNWPTNQGFDYFYGFIGGETDQFQPALVRGTRPVPVPDTVENGYHLDIDLANDCIEWMRRQKSIAPERPFFSYFSTGSAHAPHQPPLDWRGKNAGRFDMGWDEYRRQTWERQIEMGVIPEGTGLTPRPDEVPAWDDATDEEKALYCRFAENFADFLSHTDYQVGRLVDALEEMDQLDNTLVIYITGDNGSSAEGTLSGTINEIMSLNGFQPDIADVLPRIDDIGLPGTSPHYPVGWAWAGDTPFQWTKQIASHFGGTRNGTIFSWPDRIADAGGLRSQFHHVIDVAPTILEVAGITEPTIVNGVHQTPIAGTSMAYTFAAENADVPTNRYTQYFEMFGNRALYNDGWIASCRHGRLPWVNAGTFDFDQDQWELYHIEEDFSQSVDLAAEHPEKLRHLQDLFMAEAAKYNVLPLDDRFIERADVTLRPSYFYGRESVTFYPGMVRLPEGSAPKTHNVTHTITADADIPEGGAEGVLTCLGGDTAGWTFYIREDGHLVYHYNWFDMERYEVVSDRKVPAGRVQLRCEFVNETQIPGGSATVSLLIDDEPVGQGPINKQVRGRFGVECMDVGVDALTPVDKAYDHKQPYWFTGTLRKVRFDFGEGCELTPEERFQQFLSLD